MIRKTLPLVVAALLFGCSNTAPTVEAGEDVNITVGDYYSLAPIGHDDDDDTLTYAVTLTSIPAGSTTEVEDATFSYAGFVIDVPGEYVVSVVVNDGDSDSPASTLTVTAHDAPFADIVTVDAILPGETAMLDGSASTVADTYTLAYQWALVGQPEGSTLDVTDTTAMISYTLADIGVYDFELEINDGEFSAFAGWSVAARNPPVVDISADVIRVFVDSSAELSIGEGTVVGPGGEAAYTWAITTAPVGSTFAFADATEETQTLTPDVGGLYTVALTINDGVFETTESINIVAEP